MQRVRTHPQRLCCAHGAGRGFLHRFAGLRGRRGATLCRSGRHGAVRIRQRRQPAEGLYRPAHDHRQASCHRRRPWLGRHQRHPGRWALQRLVQGDACGISVGRHRDRRLGQGGQRLQRRTLPACRRCLRACERSRRGDQGVAGARRRRRIPHRCLGHQSGWLDRADRRRAFARHRVPDPGERARQGLFLDLGIPGHAPVARRWGVRAGSESGRFDHARRSHRDAGRRGCTRNL